MTILFSVANLFQQLWTVTAIYTSSPEKRGIWGTESLLFRFALGISSVDQL